MHSSRQSFRGRGFSSARASGRGGMAIMDILDEVSASQLIKELE